MAAGRASDGPDGRRTRRCRHRRGRDLSRTPEPPFAPAPKPNRGSWRWAEPGDVGALGAGRPGVRELYGAALLGVAPAIPCWPGVVAVSPRSASGVSERTASAWPARAHGRIARAMSREIRMSRSISQGCTRRDTRDPAACDAGALRREPHRQTHLCRRRVRNPGGTVQRSRAAGPEYFRGHAEVRGRVLRKHAELPQLPSRSRPRALSSPMWAAYVHHGVPPKRRLGQHDSDASSGVLPLQPERQRA